MRQMEYNAQNAEALADFILQANTVEPKQMVSGQLILKNCCDASATPNDTTIRFEVGAHGKTNVFEFKRAQLAK